MAMMKISASFPPMGWTPCSGLIHLRNNKFNSPGRISVLECVAIGKLPEAKDCPAAYHEDE